MIQEREILQGAVAINLEAHEEKQKKSALKELVLDGAVASLEVYSTLHCRTYNEGDSDRARHDDIASKRKEKHLMKRLLWWEDMQFH